MRPAKLCLALLLTVVLASPAALAAGRVALVVGNSAYAAIGALPNPGNDATDVAAALGRLGFDVTTVRDADRVGMSEALRIFTRESAGADVSLVFYAGHGLEMDGVNYLVPVDAQLERDTDVRFEAVELDDVLAATVGAGLRIVILDACRNNPLARSMQRTGASRNVSRGSFGELDENLLGDETLVAYAAAAGTTAADGTGRNSPYTTALLEYLEEPLEIGILFREVRGRVLEETGGGQRPHEYASLLNEHYLRGASGPGTTVVTAVTSNDTLVQQETVFWQSIVQSTDPADFQAYLDQYPSGVFARLARNRVDALTDSGTADSPNESRPGPGAPAMGDNRPWRLTFGTPREGSVGGERRTDTWHFDGAQGQRVTVEAASSDFDTTLRLVSPDGSPVGFDDDGGEGLNSYMVVTLPVAGRYRVEVAPYSGEGAYEVAVRPFSGLTLNRRVQGRISRDRRIDDWAIEGTAEQWLAIEATSSDFDTTLTLVAPDGARVGFDDDGGDGRNSRLVTRLPSSGRYEVGIAPFGDGGDGQYGLIVRSITALFLSGLESDDVQKFVRRCSRVAVTQSRTDASFVLVFGRESNDGAVLRDALGNRVRRFGGTLRQNSLFDDVCEYF